MGQPACCGLCIQYCPQSLACVYLSSKAAVCTFLPRQLFLSKTALHLQLCSAHRRWCAAQPVDSWQWVHAGTGWRLLKLPCRHSRSMRTASGQVSRRLRPSWQPANVPGSGRSCRLGSAGLRSAANSGTASEWYPLPADEQHWQQVGIGHFCLSSPGNACVLHPTLHWAPHTHPNNSSQQLSVSTSVFAYKPTGLLEMSCVSKATERTCSRFA